MSGRGFRGNSRGRRGVGGPRRGDGFRKRPQSESHDIGPPPKSYRGRGGISQSGRGRNDGGDWMRRDSKESDALQASDNHYDPPHHHFNEPGPSDMRQMHDRQHQMHDRQHQMPSYVDRPARDMSHMAGPMSSSLPRPIPALRDDHQPHFNHQTSRMRESPRDDQQPLFNHQAGRVRESPRDDHQPHFNHQAGRGREIPRNSHQSHFNNHEAGQMRESPRNNFTRPSSSSYVPQNNISGNQEYYRDTYNDPPQFSPNPPPPSPPSPRNFTPRGGRGSSRARAHHHNNSRGGRGGAPTASTRGTVRGGSIGASSSSRGRGQSPFARGKGQPSRSRGKGPSTKRPINSHKPSALERLGPRVPSEPRSSTSQNRNEWRERSSEASTSLESRQEKHERYVFKEGESLNVICRHCDFKASEWAGYKAHLSTQTHTASLRNLKQKLHQRITVFRNNQRRRQNKLTKQMEIDGSLFDENGHRKATLFCKLCKLIFNQSRQVHDESQDHIAINDFLNPKCDLCKSQFSTPMSFEKHLSSVKHLQNILDPDSAGKREAQENEVSDGEEFDFNPDELVTLDEVVGDDEEDNEDTVDDEPEKIVEEADDVESVKDQPDQDSGEKVEIKGEEKNEEEVKIETEEEMKPLPDEAIGQEYVRQVVMFYCDLCHKYLPKSKRDDPDKLIDIHCASPAHQDAFVKKEAEKREEEDEALKALTKDEANFNEDQLDYEAEYDVKSESSEK